MEATGTSNNIAATHSGRTNSGRTGAYTEPGCACARSANLGRGWRYRERSNENGESEPAWHLLFRFRFRRQPEINAAIVVLFCGGSQVKSASRSCDAVPASSRTTCLQSPRSSGLQLVTVFEDEHGFRLVRDRGLRRRCRWSCLRFRLRSIWPRIGIRIGRRRHSRAAAIEDGRSATVLLFRPIFLLVGYRVARVRFSNYGIRVRHVDRTTAWKNWPRW